MKLRPLFLAAVGLMMVAALPAVTLEELAQRPEFWPTQVKINGTSKATVIRNGQPAGMMLLGAGRTLVVSSVGADGVTGRAGDATVCVPADKTDLFAQVAQAHPEARGESQPEAALVVEPVKEAPTMAAVPTGKTAITPIQRALAGRLVHLEKGSLKTFDARQLNGVKYYVVLFSAGWCGPCRQFAPVLLDQYRKLKQAHPEFELVLYSWDRSAGAMKDYMNEEAMPWPALKFDDRESVAPIAQLAGPGIPCLVLIDANGQVLSHSFDGNNYLGPGVPLDKAWQVMGRGR